MEDTTSSNELMGTYVFNIFRFWPALIYATISIFGVQFNFSVCYLTLKYRKMIKTLSYNTSILIALNSFCELLHQIGHFSFFTLTSFGINFIPARMAFIIHFLPILGFLFSISSFISLSADRLLAVAIPLIYRNLNQKFYIIGHFVVNVGINAYTISIIIDGAWNDPDFIVSSHLGGLWALPKMGISYLYISNAILITSAIFYLLIGIFVKCNTEVTNERLQKIYRSLFLILCINVGGYLISNLIIILQIITGGTILPQDSWFWVNFPSFILDIAAALNAPILYFNSNDYKLAYQKEFELGKKWICKYFFQRQLINPQTNTIIVMPTSQLVRSIQHSGQTH